MNGKRACSGLECRTKFVSLRCLSEPRTQRSGVSGRVPWGTAYSALLRARLGYGGFASAGGRLRGPLCRFAAIRYIVDSRQELMYGIPLPPRGRVMGRCDATYAKRQEITAEDSATTAAQPRRQTHHQ